MKLEKEFKIISEIISMAEFRRPETTEQGPYKYFGIGGNPIAFKGRVKYNSWQEKITSLYKLNKEVEKTYSLKKFEIKIIDLVRNVKLEERMIDHCEVEYFFESLIKEPIVEYEVLHEIFGCTLNEAKTTFGDFTIYNLEKSKAELFQNWDSFEANSNRFLGNINSKLLISIKISARDEEKAHEVANGYFTSFENIMSYVIADLTHETAVGIFNLMGSSVATTLTLTKDNLVAHNNSFSAYEELDLNHKGLTSADLGNNVIWSLITKSKPTNVEKRVLNSAEWIGKAIRDNDFSKSLIQFIIAIECMLQYNSGGFITPSIVNQLSDWAALITSENVEIRKYRSKITKSLYEKRSRVTHSGITTVTFKDLQNALKISKLLLFAFLKKEPFKNFTNMDQLSDYMNELKFK